MSLKALEASNFAGGWTQAYIEKGPWCRVGIHQEPNQILESILLSINSYQSRTCATIQQNVTGATMGRENEGNSEGCKIAAHLGSAKLTVGCRGYEKFVSDYIEGKSCVGWWRDWMQSSNLCPRPCLRAYLAWTPWRRLVLRTRSCDRAQIQWVFNAPQHQTSRLHQSYCSFIPKSGANPRAGLYLQVLVWPTWNDIMVGVASFQSVVRSSWRSWICQPTFSLVPQPVARGHESVCWGFECC